MDSKTQQVIDEHKETLKEGEVDTESAIYQAELENTINFVRQRDWFDPQKNPHSSVTMVGAGGIGSPTAIALSKLGIAHIRLIDFDEVEAHNIPNQMYSVNHAGVDKVVALKAMCEVFGATDVTTWEGKGEDYPEAYEGIVVTGLDSMDARAEVWKKVKADKDSVDFYIDARLGGQDIVLYAFDPNDAAAVEYYEMFGLFPQSEAVEAPCTAQAVIDVSFQVASQITRAVRKHLTGQKVDMVLQFGQEDLTVEK